MRIFQLIFQLIFVSDKFQENNFPPCIRKFLNPRYIYSYEIISHIHGALCNDNRKTNKFDIPPSFPCIKVRISEWCSG